MIAFSGANRILTSLTTTENIKYTPSGTTNSNAGPSNYQNNRSGLGAPPGRNLAGQFNNLGSKEIRITSFHLAHFTRINLFIGSHFWHCIEYERNSI